MNEHAKTGYSPASNEAEFISGAESIARLLGPTKRQVYYMAERGDLPIGRIRGKLYALRSRLVDHLDVLSTASLA
jgi:hypothetical protein